MSIVNHISDLATAIGNLLRDSVLPRLLPSGGAVGQVLAKSAAADYAAQWADQAAGGGSIFGATQIFKPDVGGVIGNMLTAQAATQAMVAGREDISPFVSAFDLSIDLAYISASTGVTGSSVRVVVYASDANGRPTGAPVLSGAIDTTNAGTKSAGISYSFEKGKMYWLGVRLGPTGTPTLRVAQPYAHYALTWSTASTPARSAVLRRTIGIGDTTDYPAFSNSLITAASTPMVLMRIA